MGKEAELVVNRERITDSVIYRTGENNVGSCGECLGNWSLEYFTLIGGGLCPLSFLVLIFF